jgi:hypothetical protein
MTLNGMPSNQPTMYRMYPPSAAVPHDRIEEVARRMPIDMTVAGAPGRAAKKVRTAEIPAIVVRARVSSRLDAKNLQAGVAETTRMSAG